MRFLRLAEVQSKTGLKRDAIYRGAKAGTFPRPVKISEWASGWVESEVDAFIADRIAARDKLAAPKASARKLAQEGATA